MRERESRKREDRKRASDQAGKGRVGEKEAGKGGRKEQGLKEMKGTDNERQIHTQHVKFNVHADFCVNTRARNIIELLENGHRLQIYSNRRESVRGIVTVVFGSDLQ